MTYDDLSMAVLLVRLLFVLVGGILWGFVAKHIVKSKGYPDEMNKGFWWGFFLGWIGLIICVTKQPYNNPNRFDPYGGGYNNYNPYGGQNPNMYGNRNMYNGGQQYTQQPGQQQYGQPQQYSQPQYTQQQYTQQQYGQPNSYYQPQNAQPQEEHNYVNAAEMDGIDTSGLDLDNLK